jgi:hypothetical protein
MQPVTVRKQWGFLIRAGLRGLRPALKLQEHATESCKQRMVSHIGTSGPLTGRTTLVTDYLRAVSTFIGYSELGIDDGNTGAGQRGSGHLAVPSLGGRE